MHLKNPHFWELHLLCCLLFSCSAVSPWTAAHQGSLSFTISWSLLKLMYWVSGAIQPSHPLSPTSPVSGSFPMSQLVASDGQSIGASTSASVLPIFRVIPALHVRVLSHFSHVCLCSSIDCSLPGFSVQGILQARILEWVAMPSSRGSSWPRDRTHVSYVSCIGRCILYH